MSAFVPKVLLYRGSGIIGRLIRWQSRGDYGHAALWLAEDEILESAAGHGVWRRPASALQDADIYEVDGMTREQWALAATFARTQLLKPYDWTGCLRFISRRPESALRWMDSWFCSELVFAAIQAAGVDLLARIPAWKVSPALLSTSPLLLPFATQQHVEQGPQDPRVKLFRFVHHHMNHQP